MYEQLEGKWFYNVCTKREWKVVAEYKDSVLLSNESYERKTLGKSFFKCNYKEVE